MQRSISLFQRLKMISAVLILTSYVNALAGSEYVTGTYKVDPDHTRVSFIVSHLMISEVEGRFNDVKGEFTLAEPFTNSKVSATIPTRSIDTGVRKRDSDLKGKDFFDVGKFPQMKLVSKSITGTPEAFKVVVALTIKDVTKDVTFDGKYTGYVKDPWGKQRVAVQLTGEVNRKDFNLTYNTQFDAGAAVGDQVKIRIWTEGVK